MSFPQVGVKLSNPVLPQLSSIASQSTLGAGLLSQAPDLAPTELPSADPRTEPISVEITDTSITVENVSSIFDTCWSIFLDLLIHYYSHPLFGYLSYQTLFDETPVQEQEFGSSPIDNDPIDVVYNPVAGT